ncbi:hypothetical protein [Pandoraea terrigena]|uniref:Uncharacterized protein n=2 Tax=Pandoraea TaxID=93217 RepID=A0A5E4XI67_9BURK|nr:hypothetical protein [Pandoraea terrigena]VVE35993.1 hypothetical protein PTE31013_03926 [Pandoraea terrigena]
MMSSLALSYPRDAQGRDLAVGDIHGHFTSLDTALRKANFSPAVDRVFSVGERIGHTPLRQICRLANVYYIDAGVEQANACPELTYRRSNPSGRSRRLTRPSPTRTMNARQLTSLWEHYAVANNLRLQEADSIATLFGMDEVDVDYTYSRIVLPDAGVVEVEGLADQEGEIEWVALVDTDESMWVVLGTGTPFEAQDTLPTVNGVVMAVPAAVRRRMPGTLPGIPVFFPNAA